MAVAVFQKLLQFLEAPNSPYGLYVCKATLNLNIDPDTLTGFRWLLKLKNV